MATHSLRSASAKTTTQGDPTSTHIGGMAEALSRIVDITKQRSVLSMELDELKKGLVGEQISSKKTAQYVRCSELRGLIP